MQNGEQVSHILQASQGCEQIPDEAGPLEGPFLVTLEWSASFLLPFFSSARVLGGALASPASLRPAAASSEAEPGPFALATPIRLPAAWDHIIPTWPCRFFVRSKLCALSCMVDLKGVQLKLKSARHMRGLAKYIKGLPGHGRYGKVWLEGTVGGKD